MAAMTTTQQPPLNPSRNPLPLSASQESQVRELYHKRVRQKCADEVRGQSSLYTIILQCPLPLPETNPASKSQITHVNDLSLTTLNDVMC